MLTAPHVGLCFSGQRFSAYASGKTYRRVIPIGKMPETGPARKDGSMMTRNLIAIAAFLARALCAVPVHAAPQPVNLVSNGGFEEGLAGWSQAAGHSVVRASGMAHSGQACLSGAATGENQALFLRQSVRVKANHQYRFEIWARATNRTKLVLHVVQPGEKQRQLVAPWQDVPDRWSRYTTSVNVQKDGTLELHLVAPSSYSAPAGQMWIDEIALYETPLPVPESVSKGVGFNDEPAIARTDDGSLYVAWNSFRDGADSLQVARYRLQGEALEQLGQWQVLGGEGTYVWGIRAVGAGKNVLVLFSAEKDGDWDIYAATCSSDGPGAPVAVTSDSAVDVKPAAVWHEGTLWVAWESNRNGRRQVFAASIRDGEVSHPVAVSESNSSCYAPTIAVLDCGDVCVGWHSFHESNYDVYLRRRAAGTGSWGPQIRLTRAPSVDRHAALVCRGDDLWIVYENAQLGDQERLGEQVGDYRVTKTSKRRLMVAKVTPEGLVAPEDHGQASPLDGHCEAASAAFDSSGRLWLALLRPQQPKGAGWEAWTTCFNGDRWQSPNRVCARKGMDRRPGLVVEGNRAIVALQVDEIPRTWWRSKALSLKPKSDVVLTTVDLGSAPPATPVELEPFVEPDEPFPAAEIRAARGEDSLTPSINYRGQTLKLFYGNLHEHTDVSVCQRIYDQSIDESYQHMRDITHLDFACVTDHGFNINPYYWSYIAKLARANDDPDHFLTFLGEEWTSTFEKYSEKHPFGYYGHRNLVFADPYFPKWFNAQNGQTPAELWEELRRLNADFVQIPHQLADTGNVPVDWDFADEDAQPVAEIFQVRGSYEYKRAPREAVRSIPARGNFIQDAWARGIVIGVIASPDHGGGYGKACVYATELTRPAILDAIRARRCFGTTAAKIFLDVRANGHLMGEKVAAGAGKSVKVEIQVRCPADIDRVEVCRNNRFIYTNRPEGREAQLSFVDCEPIEGRSYYYVRVIQKDEEIAWSSPIWFGAQ